MTEAMTANPRGASPSPDPTILTTEALTREVTALKALLEWRIDGEAEARKAADESEHEKVGRELHLIERQRVEQKTDTALAVAAALTAQKEAVKEQTAASAMAIAKSENATNEQLKQLTVTFTTAIDGVNRTISDLKERVGKNENVQATQGGVGKGASSAVGWLFAGLMSVIAVVTIILEAFATR